MRLAAVDCFAYDLPLVEPLRVGGREQATRAGWLIRVRDGDGREGWGDVAPLPGFSRESPAQAWRDLQAVVPSLVSASVDDADPVRDLAARLDNACSSVRFGIACAVWEAAAAGASGWRPWPASASAIAVCALLGGAPSHILERAHALAGRGYGVVKVKVGRQAPAADAAMVGQVAAILGGDVALRVDANRAWTLDQAVEFARAWTGRPPAYVEEPLREPSGLPRFHEATGLPLALDETVAEREDAGLGWPGLRALVMKPTVCGGLQRARDLAASCAAKGIALVISAAFESGVGVRALARMAAGVGSAAAGLDTYRWLAGDVLTPRLDMARPMVELHTLEASIVDTTHLRRLL